MSSAYVPRFQNTTRPQQSNSAPGASPRPADPTSGPNPARQEVSQNPSRRRPLTIQQEQQRSIGAMVAAGAPVEHMEALTLFLQQPMTLDDQRQRLYGGLTILGFPVSRVAVFEDEHAAGGYRARVFVSPDRCKREGITPDEATVILFGQFLIQHLCQPGTPSFNIYGGIGREGGEDYVGLEFENLQPAFVKPVTA